MSRFRANRTKYSSFSLFESRPKSIRRGTRRERTFRNKVDRRWIFFPRDPKRGVRGSRPSSSPSSRENGARTNEDPSVPFQSSPDVKGRTNMRENVRGTWKRKHTQKKKKKTGIFGSDFPSDARHLGPV